MSTFVPDRRVIFLPVTFPKIVCLCGSTRFKQEFIQANFRETMAGNIVLSVGLYGHADASVYTPTAEEKLALDELHKRKIDLADEVLVLNCKRFKCSTCGQWIHESTCGCSIKPCYGAQEHWQELPYIGDSTRSEIAYAQEQGKVIRYLEESS